MSQPRRRPVLAASKFQADVPETLAAQASLNGCKPQHPLNSAHASLAYSRPRSGFGEVPNGSNSSKMRVGWVVPESFVAPAEVKVTMKTAGRASRRLWHALASRGEWPEAGRRGYGEPYRW